MFCFDGLYAAEKHPIKINKQLINLIVVGFYCLDLYRMCTGFALIKMFGANGVILPRRAVLPE